MCSFENTRRRKAHSGFLVIFTRSSVYYLNACRATVRIMHRHHFASKLQRMCTVARVTENDRHRTLVLVKGVCFAARLM